jgi:hypothetical protein
MKIKKSIKTNVTESVENCKKAIGASIKELCMMVDRKESGKIYFGKPVPLTTSMMIHEKHLQTKTFFADSIGWCPDTNYYTLYYDGDIMTSSIYLSVDEFLAIYKVLLNVVSRY